MIGNSTFPGIILLFSISLTSASVAVDPVLTIVCNGQYPYLCFVTVRLVGTLLGICFFYIGQIPTFHLM